MRGRGLGSDSGAERKLRRSYGVKRLGLPGECGKDELKRRLERAIGESDWRERVERARGKERAERARRKSASTTAEVLLDSATRPSLGPARRRSDTSSRQSRTVVRKRELGASLSKGDGRVRTSPTACNPRRERALGASWAACCGLSSALPECASSARGCSQAVTVTGIGGAQDDAAYRSGRRGSIAQDDAALSVGTTRLDHGV